MKQMEVGVEIGANRWVSSNYLVSYLPNNATIKGYSTGRYKVSRVSKNSVLNVREGLLLQDTLLKHGGNYLQTQENKMEQMEIIMRTDIKME